MTGQGPGQEHSGTLLRLATVLKRNDSTPGVPCCSTLQTGRPLVGYYNRDNRRSTRNISCLWSSDQKQSQQQLGRGQRSWTTKESTGKSKITLSDYYSQGREWTSSKLVWFISCRHILRTAGLRLGKRTTCSEWTRGGGWNVNLFTPTKVSAKMRPHKTSLLKPSIISEFCSHKTDAVQIAPAFKTDKCADFYLANFYALSAWKEGGY